jgi:hypothetical protein
VAERDAFDLHGDLREELIDFLQRELPGALPRQRQLTLTPAAPDRDTSSPSR